MIETKFWTKVKQLVFRNLTLEIYKNNNWKVLETLENGREPEKSTAWLAKTLTFNDRRTLWLNRRMLFWNCMLTQDYDDICFTETCLTQEVPNDATFSDNYTLYSRIRDTNLNNSKKCGVFIAVNKQFLQQEVKLKTTPAYIINVTVTSMSGQWQKCCPFNAPLPSHYTWSSEDLHLLLNCLESNASLHECTSTKFTGDIHFDKNKLNNSHFK